MLANATRHVSRARRLVHLLGHNPEDLEAEVFQLGRIPIIHGQILSKPAPYHPVSLMLHVSGLSVHLGLVSFPGTSY